MLANNNINLLFICIFSSLTHYCVGQCSKENPFYMIDQACANFNEVCIKKDSEVCNQLLNACDQCPPNNVTVSALIDIVKIMKSKQNTSNEIIVKQVNNFKDQILRRIGLVENRSDIKLIVIIVLMMILILLLIIFFLKWRTMKKYLNVTRRGRIESYDELKVHEDDTTNPKIEQSLTDKKMDFDRKLDAILGKLTNGNIDRSREEHDDAPWKNSDIKINRTLEQTLAEMDLKLNSRFEEIYSTILNRIFSGCKIKFQIIGEANQIELQISSEDNIVKVKRKLCAKWINAKPYLFKLMKLKLNGKDLDDNQYFCPLIGSSTDIVHCKIIDGNLNPNEIIVLQLRGNIQLPEMIQINRNITIENLKSIISKIIQVNDFKIFKESGESLKELEKVNGLGDYDWIQVIYVESGTLSINPIFDQVKSFEIEYINIESVSDLKTKISQILHVVAKDLILFCKNKCLKNEILLFQIEISSNPVVTFCHLMKMDKDLKITNMIVNGNFSDILNDRQQLATETITMNKYSLLSKLDSKENKEFLNELLIFQITKSHPRFVQLKGIFQDENYYYIAMEKMKGSLKTFVGSKNVLAEIEIAKFAKEILEALKYLHDNNIIYGNMKSSNILLDKDNNVKLCNFQLSTKYYCREKLEADVDNDKRNGIQADIWSFGTTILEMITGKPPISCLSEMSILAGIGKRGGKENGLQNRSESLKDFIKCSLVFSLKIDDLLQHEFLRGHRRSFSSELIMDNK